MVFSIILVALVAFWVWWKKTHYNDSVWVKNRIKGRNDEQKAVIRYFCNEPSCLSKKPITDGEYEEMVSKYLTSNDFKQKAMSKLGVDEDEVKDADPIHFEGYRFDNDSLSKKGKDDLWRSSKYQVTWIFFGKGQLYVYQNTFFMDEDGRKERTEEYFYKDVTNFSITSETEDIEAIDKNGKKIKFTIDTDTFVIKVYGEKFECSVRRNDYTEKAIQGMKALLRDKKNS